LDPSGAAVMLRQGVPSDPTTNNAFHSRRMAGARVSLFLET
jgi:hypothetical protein